MDIFVIYLISINLFAVFITAFDKHRAKTHQYRVSEFTLMLVSALGGSIAMYLTMLFIRHKTRHTKFMLGIPLIILIQLAVASIVWRLLYV